MDAVALDEVRNWNSFKSILADFTKSSMVTSQLPVVGSNLILSNKCRQDLW